MITTASDTKDTLLTAATILFATHGFAGTSIATIAAEVGVTKQALLHHFKTKDALYRLVLARVTDRIAHVLDTDTDLPGAIRAFYDYAVRNPAHMKLVMREMLDHDARAQVEEEWALQPMVERLTKLAKKRNPNLKKSEAFSLIYLILGGINYYAVSTTTLQQNFGAKTYARTKLKMPDAIETLIAGPFK